MVEVFHFRISCREVHCFTGANIRVMIGPEDVLYVWKVLLGAEEGRLNFSGKDGDAGRRLATPRPVTAAYFNYNFNQVRQGAREDPLLRLTFLFLYTYSRP